MLAFIRILVRCRCGAGNELWRKVATLPYIAPELKVVAGGLGETGSCQGDDYNEN